MTREELSKMVELLRDTAKIHQPNEEILTDVKAESFIFIMDSVLSALSENKGEWIPANVPPKESGRYLTYIVNEYDEKLQYIMTADYIARPTPIDGLSPWNVDDECASDNVVAWQPLPEPYKAESEDK